MATWVSHLAVADKILERLPWLHRREFCVGNIAPDCNVENSDFTSFSPPREVTHWMGASAKSLGDGERFLAEFVAPKEPLEAKEASFLLGYYAHLVTDAEYRSFTRDGERLRAAFARISSCPALCEKALGMAKDWETVKALIPKEERLRDVYAMEKKYLELHPRSGYITEILPLEEFPDYISYLPHGAVLRKIKVLGYMPKEEKSKFPYIAISEQEYKQFLDKAAETAVNGILSYKSRRRTDSCPREKL